MQPRVKTLQLIHCTVLEQSSPLGKSITTNLQIILRKMVSWPVTCETHFSFEDAAYPNHAEEAEKLTGSE